MGLGRRAVRKGKHVRLAVSCDEELLLIPFGGGFQIGGVTVAAELIWARFGGAIWMRPGPPGIG